MPRKGSPYSGSYRKERLRVLGFPCQLKLACSGSPADSADHFPPLNMHDHLNGSGCCVLRPACMACQWRQAQLLAAGQHVPERSLPPPSRDW